jgi:tetratricopeptide (TPR) repeat protein
VNSSDIQAKVADILNSAVGQHRSGRFDDAEDGYRQALELQPDNADAHHLLGVLALQRGAFDSAVTSINRALAIDGTSAAFHGSLADALGKLERYAEAETHYARSIEIKPGHFQTHYNLGNLLRVQGKREEALASYRHAMELAPEFADACNNVGALLAEMGRLDEAISLYRDAARKHPSHPAIHNNMGNALKLAGQLEEAAAAYRRVTELAPGAVEGLRNLAATLKDLGQVREGEALCRKALGMSANDPLVLDTLGNILMADGRVDEALKNYDRALAIHPEFAAAHGNRSMALLLKGDFERGWEEYEWRWQSDTFTSAKREFPKPLWDGTPLGGRTILLHTEQGMGDAIQFARYLPMVAERGGKIILACQSELVRLFNTLPGPERVVSYGELPDFDCHAPLLSLPRLFGTRPDTIPAEVPYLGADAELTRIWAKRIGEAPGPKVGVVWRGNPDQRVNRARSCPPEMLRALEDVPDIHLFSLQKETGDDGVPEGFTDLGRHLDDFADTAAAIQQLDAVVSICTSVAHLAGALGCPTWIMLAFAADWRWLQEREDSPWYPSARLVRQQAPGDWAAVVKRVADALRAEAQDFAP